MIKEVGIKEFLLSGTPTLDVRSEGEFNESHIIDAVNIPLLNDEHRKQVGTVYKIKGKEAAIKLGYSLVNPLKEQLLARLEQVSSKKQVKLYCARGGLRSAKMADFYNQNGYEVMVLKGGYKSYRNHVLKTIFSFRKILILSGYTGCGKTEVLNALSKMNAQVLDLEFLACHKGSAFGSLGYGSQPGSAQFHNKIFDAIKMFDSSRLLWVENESMTIGKVSLPLHLWENMKQAEGFEIVLPLEERLNFILDNYGKHDLVRLATCIKSISKRLGDQETRQLCELVMEGNLRPVVLRLFRYYDKAYDYGRQKKECQNFVKISFDKLDPQKIAGFLYSEIESKFKHNP